LVFLAGSSFNAHAFDDFAPRFTNRHRVIGINRRGHGASSWPDSGYTLSTLVQDIRAVFDSLDVQRAILAGHSFAGSEMTRFAAEHPDRLAGLIYIDAAHDHTMSRGFNKVCPPFDAAMQEAFLRTVKNPDMVMGTQLRTGPDGVPQPFASPSALKQMTASLPSPDYKGVGVPALGIFTCLKGSKRCTQGRAHRRRAGRCFSATSMEASPHSPAGCSGRQSWRFKTVSTTCTGRHPTKSRLKCNAGWRTCQSVDSTFEIGSTTIAATGLLSNNRADAAN
jgi:pimeloyl-ACP methyl ester carboxylesterase